MPHVLLYLATLVLFLALDFLGLSYIVKPVFDEAIGPLLLEDFRFLPAALFYAFYVAVLIWFVSWPALRDDKPTPWVFGNAALLGAMGYGTYEFTSYAVMADWTLRMVVVDLVWGTLLTAVSATAGFLVARRMI
ncbi:MAG: DUF2177 family protein [Sulfitobacter sp.]|nr:DUF2177 family protein [Sulfitobacter sp.]